MSPAPACASWDQLLVNYLHSYPIGQAVWQCEPKVLALASLRQEDRQYEISLGYISRPCQACLYPTDTQILINSLILEGDLELGHIGRPSCFLFLSLG